MKIDVTQQHIEIGTPKDCAYCPISHSLMSHFPNSCIEVDGSCIEINGIQYYSPDSVVKFITAFDSGFPVKPFSFELLEILDNF